MTDTRATLYVPDPSPETSMNLGKAWSGTDWNSDGFCVNTDGRIWLDANGDTASTSTLTLLSNGSGSDGQLLLQSLQSNLYVFGKSVTVVSSDESILVAGGDGVRLIAGHGEEYGFNLPFGAFWTVVNDATIDSVGPSDSDPSSDFAATYTGRMDTVSQHWGIVSASIGVGALITEIVRAAMGCNGVGSSANTTMKITALTAATSMVSGAIDMSKMGADEIPGLQIHSYGAINMATTGFCSVMAGAGLHLVAGISNTIVGVIEAGAFGGLGAALKGSKNYDINGTRVELTAGLSVTYQSNLYSMDNYGLSMAYGQVVPTWPTQVPTVSVDVQSTKIDAFVMGGKIDVLSTGEVKIFSGTYADIQGGMGVTIKSPAYQIKVLPTGISISCAITTKVDLTPLSSSVTFDNATMKAEVSAEGITIGDAAGACTLVVSETKHELKGPMVTFT